MNTNPYSSPEATNEEPRSPVKVKVYGLISMTRNAYLTLQIVLALATVVLLIGLGPVFAAPGHPLGFVNEHLVTIIIVMLLLEGVETAMVLKKFKKAEQNMAQQIPDD